MTELEYFFPQKKLTIIDFLSKCLGFLPDSAEYHSEYLSAGGNEEFWKKIELPGGADDSYICIGVKASTVFVSEKGLGGGDWIIMNKYLQAEIRDGAL